MLGRGGTGLLCRLDGHVHHHVVVPQRHLDVGRHGAGHLSLEVRGDHHHALCSEPGHFRGEVGSGRAGAEKDTLSQGFMVKSQHQTKASRAASSAS